MNKQMTPTELKENIKSFLKEHKQASLATYGHNMPRSSPVQYFVGNDLDIYIFSAGGDKFENIHEKPDVCLLVNSEYISLSKIKGVQIFGKAATSIDNSAIYDEAKKYSPDQHLLEEEQNTLKVIKIEPSEIVYLDSLENGNRTKQILKGNEVMLREDKPLMFQH